MELILWRHAEAEDGAPDLLRALTPKGRQQARRMAAWLGAHLPDDCKILVSPALRTRQTVEPLGRAVEVVAQLAPGASAQDVLDAANWPDSKQTVLVVGHQPTLGEVAALLLSGQAQHWQMKKASAWWIVQRAPRDPDSLYLKAVMAPELLAK